MKVAAMAWPASLALTVLSAAPAWATPYDFTPIVVQPGASFDAGGLNDAGQIAGTYVAGPSGQMFTFGIPALYDHGTITPLGFGGSPSLNNFYAVNGINDSGLVIASVLSTHSRFPLVYQNGSFINLPLSTLNDSAVNAVNNKGDIVGFATESQYGGFLFSGGAVTSIGVPDAASPGHFLPTNLTGINDAGQIVGTYGVGFNGTLSTGFLLSGGTYSQIMVPGSQQTFPTAINDSGEVVGTFTDLSGTGDHGFEEQGGVFTTIIGPNGADFLPVGLNNLGQILGSPDGDRGDSFLGTPQVVPEPSTLALLGAALTGLIGWRARTRQGDAWQQPAKGFQFGVWPNRRQDVPFGRAKYRKALRLGVKK